MGDAIRAPANGIKKDNAILFETPADRQGVKIDTRRNSQHRRTITGRRAEKSTRAEKSNHRQTTTLFFIGKKEGRLW